MGAQKQHMLPSFWSYNSTAITGDFKHLIVCNFPAGLASEISRESPKKNQGCCIVIDYSVATIDCAPFNSSDIYLFINIYTCIDGELARSQLKIKAVATVDCGSIMCCDIGAIRQRHG